MNLKRLLLTCTLGLILALGGILGPAFITQAADPDPGLVSPPLQSFTQPAPVHHPLGQAVSLPEPALAQTTLAQLPLRFIPNQGQTDPAVKFHVHSLGGSLFFSPQEVVFSLPAPVEEHESSLANRKSEIVNRKSEILTGHDVVNRKSVVRLTFDGANPTPTIEGLTPLPGGANFFLGNDPARWQNNLPTYEGIVYRDLYPGIDLVYRGTDGQLKSEFVVAPGADPNQIRLRYDGAESLSVREDGALVIQTAVGELVEAPLLIYQEVEGVRREVEGRYVLAEKEGHKLQSETIVSSKSEIVNPLVSFQIVAYDPAFPLVIDPELVFSTYLGGNQRDQGYGIAVDKGGNIYVTGYADSSNFPTKRTLQDQLGNEDVFVTQFINGGGVYTYGFSSFLGGGNIEKGTAIAVDNRGNIYITGDTDSNDFPTRQAIQTDQPGRDSFITQLISVTGVYTLGYSTYLGGSDSDTAIGLAIDNEGNVYVTGGTYSTDFPTQNAIQDMYGGGNGDGFVTKIISASGVYTFGYSTYLGGNAGDSGYDLVIDKSGNVYVTGLTLSSNFSTHNAIMGNMPNTNSFVTQIIKNGGVYTYGFSTYLGGSNIDVGEGIALDGDDNIYILGSTLSSDFPTWKPIQADQPGQDVFVTKLIGASGIYTYGYSTYLGGSGDENGEAIAVDSLGNAYIVGGTSSLNFPLRNSIQNTYGGGFSDSFVTKIVSVTGVYSYGYSTYLGGADIDSIIDIAVDSAGIAYVIGDTVSTDFPTQNASQKMHAGGMVDAFVAKLSSGPALTIIKTVNTSTAQISQTITYTYRITNTGDVPLTNLAASDDKLGAVALSPTTLAPHQTANGTLTYTVLPTDLPGPLVNTVIVTGTPPTGPLITGTAAASVTLTASGGGSDYSNYLPLILKN